MPAHRGWSIVAKPSLRKIPLASSPQRRLLFNARRKSRTPHDLDLANLYAKRRDYDQKRNVFLWSGLFVSVSILVIASCRLNAVLDLEHQKKKAAAKCDTPAPNETFKTEAGEKRKVVLHDEGGNEIVPTGNGVVASFPRLIKVDLPSDKLSSSGTGPVAASVSDHDGTEFTLVGLGLRTVTFLGISVYLVGFYVATQDIARLQHFLIKKINPLATTLIPYEKEALRKALLDVVDGEQTWDSILREAGCRTVFRISPVKDTDFQHLRDGFVRAIQTRSQRDRSYDDEAFGAAMKQFKDMFSRMRMAKRNEMLLCRASSGTLSVLHGPGDEKSGRSFLGSVADERISRLLWLNYLAGNKVASEKARQNIIDGVMEFVETDRYGRNTGGMMLEKGHRSP